MTKLDLRPHVAGLTDVGLRRRANEDSMILRNDVGLWAVADGMGGHQGGRWASQQVKEALDQLTLTGDFDEDFRRISGTVHAVNATIAEAGEKAGGQMGTTIAALHCSGTRYVIFWAGDSRVYLLRQGELVRMTTDHSQVQEMVDAGLLTQEQAERHPNRNILSRAVGVAATLTLDAVVGEIEPDDCFLICSDGLTGVVSESEISERLAAGPPEVTTRELLNLVLSRGAPDNVTILAISYEGAIAPD